MPPFLAKLRALFRRRNLETEMAEEWLDDQRFVDVITRRTPTRRWGVPADYAAIAAYLADPTLTFHTGDVITVDGGYSVQ